MKTCDCSANVLIISRWPRYSYNALTSKMIVQCMSSPLHQCFSEAFLVAVHRATADLPASIDSTITTTSNEDFNEFFEQYEGSGKIPDAAVFLDDINGSTHVKIAMEVGFSENYQDLFLLRTCLNRPGSRSNPNQFD